MLRNEGVENIAYFTHIAQGSGPFLEQQPHGKELLDAQLGADVVCSFSSVHTKDFSSAVKHFYPDTKIQTHQNGNATLALDNGRTVDVIQQPLGVIKSNWTDVAYSDELLKSASQWMRETNNRPLVFWANRADVTKGHDLALNTIDQFLQDNPDNNAQFVFVAQPNGVSSYPQWKEDITSRIAEINQEYKQKKGYEPIIYKEGMEKAELGGLMLAAARSGGAHLSTSRKEGWHKLYCEAAVVAKSHGLTIGSVESENMGCVESLPGSRTHNPFDPKSGAAALKASLAESPRDRKKRFDQNWDSFIGSWDATKCFSGFSAESKQIFAQKPARTLEQETNPELGQTRKNAPQARQARI